MRFHFVTASENKKLGPIGSTFTSSDSCNSNCKMKDVCYGKFGPLSIFWKKLDNGIVGTDNFDAFCNSIKKSHMGFIRLNTVGDFFHVNGIIHDGMMNKLISAVKGKKIICYTHHDMSIKENRDIVKKANENGLTINLSADTFDDVDRYIDMKIAPVVCVLPENCENIIFTKNGNKVVKCPATYRENVSCSSCGLCAKNNINRVTIGFPAHGTKKKLANKICQGS